MSEWTLLNLGEPTRGWLVQVSRYNDLIVSISEQELAGKDITEADAETIRHAAQHLLSFVGEPRPPVGEEPSWLSDLMAFANKERDEALHAKNREKYVEFCGWVSALWRVKSMLATELQQHAERVAEKDYAIEALGDICDEYARQRSAAESSEAALRAELEQALKTASEHYEARCHAESQIAPKTAYAERAAKALATARQEIETLKQEKANGHS